mmetsp:Transcript_24564/g.82231  ORF Transcript_24564/g.82231 Transcript_24564/m.82231 type:complete len:309 (+) Transcript_24564:798-1724(+)
MCRGSAAAPMPQDRRADRRRCRGCAAGFVGGGDRRAEGPRPPRAGKARGAAVEGVAEAELRAVGQEEAAPATVAEDVEHLADAPGHAVVLHLQREGRAGLGTGAVRRERAAGHAAAADARAEGGRSERRVPDAATAHVLQVLALCLGRWVCHDHQGAYIRKTAQTSKHQVALDVLRSLDAAQRPCSGARGPGFRAPVVEPQDLHPRRKNEGMSQCGPEEGLVLEQRVRVQQLQLWVLVQVDGQRRGAAPGKSEDHPMQVQVLPPPQLRHLLWPCNAALRLLVTCFETACHGGTHIRLRALGRGAHRPR